MVPKIEKNGRHPTDNELADFLAKSLSGPEMAGVRAHISGCDHCLAAVAAAYESAGPAERKGPFKKWIGNIMKKMNLYLIMAAISFILSFLVGRYFIQLLVATLLLGIKWVVDSKTTKMLVMIYEAWKSGGEREASMVLRRMERRDRITL
jgi:hypothetical protein